MIMNTLLDNLFLFGQAISLIAVAWGAWLVLRESLAGTVFPDRKRVGPAMPLTASLTHYFRRLARV